MSVRLPRVLMAMIVGMGLSVSGAAYQAIFGNPLVSPHILGVASGAGFGASIGILVSGGVLFVQGMALGFGLLAVGLVMLISTVGKRGQLYVIVLSGVIVNSLFDALVSLTKYLADPQSKLPSIVIWLMGSLSTTSYRDLYTSGILIVLCVLVIFAIRWRLNLLSLNEEEAESLGIDVRKSRAIIIILSTLITAAAVSSCGVIGWIGLVIPHASRIFVGTDHRMLIPVSAMGGAIYLLLIDNVARSATSQELPLSILTAIIGAPFFAYILRRRGKENS